jgi:hypothetical protein
MKAVIAGPPFLLHSKDMYQYLRLPALFVQWEYLFQWDYFTGAIDYFFLFQLYFLYGMHQLFFGNDPLGDQDVDQGLVDNNLSL